VSGLLTTMFRATIGTNWPKPITCNFRAEPGDEMNRLRVIDRRARNCGDHQIHIEAAFAPKAGGK
jgi:hypothetical protein